MSRARTLSNILGSSGSLSINSSQVTTALGYTPANKSGDTFTGVVNFNGGSGGAGVILNGGSDLRIYASNGTSYSDIWCDPDPSGTNNTDTGGGRTFTHALYLQSQHCSYDRGWNDEPSITVLNNTSNGSQANFRIHGAPGVSGGDFSVVSICDGGFTGSDRRRKTNIQNIENALNIIKSLQGCKYQYVNSELNVQTHMSDANGVKFGFIAQDVKDIIPEAVKTIEGPASIPNENGYADGYVLDYASLVPLLVEAIKEQQNIIDELKAQ